MLKTYNQTITVRNSGNLIKSYFSEFIDEENKECNETTNITWNNLDEMINLLTHYCYVQLKHTKKGRILKIESFNNWSSICTYKEWKKPINLIIQKRIQETTMSIANILKFYDSDKVIKYLNERSIILNAKNTEEFRRI